MKFIATTGLFSLGLCAAVSFGQDFAPRADVSYGRQNVVSFGNQVPGRHYNAVRSASRFRMQDSPDERTREELPSPDDLVDRNVPASPVEPTRADSGHSTAGSGAAASVPHAASAHDRRDYDPTYFSSPYGDGYEGCQGPECLEPECGGEVITGDFGCGTPCCNWFGGAYWLFMARSSNRGYILNYDSTAPGVALLRSGGQIDGYQNGFETRFGRYFDCGCYGLEAAYWGIFPDDYERSVDWASLGGGALYTAIGFDGLSYNPGAGAIPVRQMYGDATRTSQLHRLRRNYEIHNIELNFLKNPRRRAGCFHYELLAGIRYFRFNDGFLYSTDYANNMFGDDPANEMHYNIDVDNNLLGFQIGGRADRYFGSCFSVNVGAKAGIYNNHVNHRQSIFAGNGFAYNSNNVDYNFDRSENEFAILSELTAGVSYDVGCNWRLTGGYRVVAACGVATSDGQIPRDYNFNYYNGQTYADDCLILHGAYVGAEYNW